MPSVLPRVLRHTLLTFIPVIGALAVAPWLYPNQLLLFNFIIFLILAQGVNIIYGFTGYLPFGYVGFFGAGAYGFSFSCCICIFAAFPALAVGALCAVLLGLLLTPLLRLSGAYFAIASLAAGMAAFQIVSNPDLTEITRGPYGVSLSGVYAPNAAYGAALACLPSPWRW